MESNVPRPPQDTTAWVADRIAETTDASSTKVTSPFTFRVNRKDRLPSFEVLVLSASRVTDDILDPLLEEARSASFVVNVPKNGIWTESGIATARNHDCAFGGIGELMSAIHQKLDDVSLFVKKENAFVERGLDQHDNVSHFDQEYDRVYTVHRPGMKSLRVVLLNEYELTAEHVRTARTSYGPFDIVLMTNPNGTPTKDALDTAKTMQVAILAWRQFLGRLGSR
jgi:hypothetical protein